MVDITLLKLIKEGSVFINGCALLIALHHSDGMCLMVLSKTTCKDWASENNFWAVPGFFLDQVM